jgi:secondary thiamine-phosphate synthase enzyme|uniref:secondary thiamine-phosphate synthase enzyme YjbQ n=1 Tax=Altererythrobacter segetis TaxID=1104773 RepID=UPI0014073EA4|nr:secondary thiamine-phosphate synthase enzyme YjbQ [Altererythrobacter segetis]
MQHTLSILTFQTDGPGLYEVSEHVSEWIAGTGISRGVLNLLCQHTSAGLLITENASAAVHRDLVRWLDAAAPEGPGYEHATEGPDDMPAHVKSMLTGSTLTIPVADGQMMLGTWQGVFIAEHRRDPHTRSLAAHLLGD